MLNAKIGVVQIFNGFGNNVVGLHLHSTHLLFWYEYSTIQFKVICKAKYIPKSQY